MLKNVELRKLPAGALYGIIEVLETNKDWKRVMSLIPKNPGSEHFEPKYNNEHTRLIEDNARSTGRRCTEILLDEWSTSGRIRPTLETLRDLVIKAEIYRAADEIAAILQETLPLRPQDGPAAAVDIDISKLLQNDSILQVLTTTDSVKKEYFEKTTKQLDRKTDDLDKLIGNQTTAEMKSASAFINFSSKMDTADIPNISALQSVSNKTTIQMKSESDLIKFSTRQGLPSVHLEEPSLESVNIPNFSAIMKSERENNSGTNTSVYTETQSDTDLSVSQFTEQTRSQESETDQHSNKFQMSLPNIEFENDNGIDSLILQDSNLIHFDYKNLDEMTCRFSPKLILGPKGLIGGCIGKGGFGEVFVGIHHKYGPLAVKKAHSNIPLDRNIAMKFFNAEVKYLSQFRHKNIVPILGFSKNGPAMCIVCEYIEGGSLEQKLAEKLLSEEQRIKIMIGTAEGLKYLHGSGVPENFISNSETDSQNSKKNNFLHGDVKSANILLTRDCVPKLCDFGLAKQFETTFIVTSPMGTSAYMAPEGFSGTITQKIDIYSYGVVLLELLTGLKAIITNNSETINIIVYIEENCIDHDITTLLDPVVINWKKAKEIYDLALKCLERQRKSRPSIDKVCEILYTTVK